MRKNIIHLLIGLTIVFLIAISLQSGFAATLSADSTNYTYVVSSAVAGDTIEFEEGNYSHSGSLVISKSLNLVAKGQVRMNSSTGANILYIAAPNVNITGFYLYGSTGNAGIYLDWNSGGTIIRNNTIVNNWNGIFAPQNIRNIIIDDNNINNNRNVGILFNPSTSNVNITILNNEFISNSGRAMSFIRLINSTIKNNTCYNQLDAGIQVNYADNVLIQENRINNTTRRSGIDIIGGTNIEISGNIISNTLGSQAFGGEYVFGISITNASNLNIHDNVITNVSHRQNNYMGGILINSPLPYSNVTISNNKIFMNVLGHILSFGILSYCFNTTIEYNEIYNSHNGVYVSGNALNSSILFNKINNTQRGILSSVGNTFIENNNISNSDYGIYISGINNIVNNNELSYNNFGLVVVSDNNRLNNNTIIYSTGIALNIIGDYNSVFGSNILNNTQGIEVTGENNTVNYNRIFSNDIDLDNQGIDNNADYNWWGSNNPNMGKILGIILGNHFVMNITNITSLNSNGTVIFKYIFKLNNSDSFDADLLPYFMTNTYTNLTTGVMDSFDARFNKTFDITVNSEGDILYIFVTDDEVQTIEGFIKIVTNSTIGADDTFVGQETVISGIVVGSDGNPLANIVLTLNVNGINYSVSTDSNGAWSYVYLPESVGVFVVSISWEGNNTHNGLINSSNFIVNDKIVTNSTVGVEDTFVGQETVISGVAVDENGDPLANIVLSLTIDGVYYNVTTDSNGAWSYVYIPKSAGIFVVSISWEGNNTHNGFINNSNFTVESIPTPTPDPEPIPTPTPESDDDKTSNNPVVNSAAMKKTGRPMMIICMLMMLSCILGFRIRRKQK